MAMLAHDSYAGQSAPFGNYVKIAAGGNVITVTLRLVTGREQNGWNRSTGQAIQNSIS